MLASTKGKMLTVSRKPEFMVPPRASQRTFLGLIQHVGFPLCPSCGVFSTTAAMVDRSLCIPLFPTKLVVKPGAIFTDDREHFLITGKLEQGNLGNLSSSVTMMGLWAIPEEKVGWVEWLFILTKWCQSPRFPNGPIFG